MGLARRNVKRYKNRYFSGGRFANCPAEPQCECPLATEQPNHIDIPGAPPAQDLESTPAVQCCRRATLLQLVWTQTIASVRARRWTLIASATAILSSTATGPLQRLPMTSRPSSPADKPSRPRASQPSTQSEIRLISSCVRLGSFLNSPKPFTAPQGGMRLFRDFFLDCLRPRPRIFEGGQRESFPVLMTAKTALRDNARNLSRPGDLRRIEVVAPAELPSPSAINVRKRTCLVSRWFLHRLRILPPIHVL